MAYNQDKLIIDVRMKLGDISMASLPDRIITYWGDTTDENPVYTGQYPWIFYKTTLECVNYLKLQSITDGSATAAKITEKVGDVERTVENSTTSGSALGIWDELYDSLEADPEGFGIVMDKRAIGSVIIGGTDTDTVQSHKDNTANVGIFMSGGITSQNPAFPTRGTPYF